MLRKLPWYFRSDDPVKTAEYLIMQAGSPGKAHDAVTKAATKMAEDRERYDYEIAFLIEAAKVQQREGGPGRCSDRKALLKVARLCRRDEKVVRSFLRALQRRLGGWTLKNFFDDELRQKTKR